MSEPEDHTLYLLRDIRAAIQALETKVDNNQEELQKRMDSIRQAINGESVLGRYAAAEVEERLTAIEQRISVLESQR